jgi:hypothetical protein
MGGGMFDELVGQAVQAIILEKEGQTLIIKTDKYKYTFVAEGDCCAVAYVLEPSEEDLKDFLGNKIVQATSRAVTVTNDDWGQQTDTEFYNLRTHKGDLTLELRTEHNGYYCGWLMLVGREELWPIHDDIREKAIRGM